MIDAVLFDLFHTLVMLEDHPGPTTAEILGVDRLAWNRAIFERADHHALGTISDPYESLKRIVESLDPEIPQERIRRAVAARPRRFRQALLHPRPDVLTTLDAIRARGLRTALISNAGHDEIGAWEESPLAPRFDAALFSCREKLKKPDPAIYLRAAERISIPPERCLFVGDGGSDEHAGARTAGMQTVLFLGMLNRAHPSLAAARPRETDHRIEAFCDLLSLVDSIRLR